jgi:YidC/Oxa1 family membrane protein insertase
MWNTFFVEPVLNLLIAIQSFMPGNDLGLAILVFTIITRMLMWPLIKKQIHQTRIMQKVTPEINAIRAKSKGSKDRATMERINKETMEVYKKHGISPFSSIGTLLIQLPLFLAIYSAVKVAFEGSSNLSSLLYAPVKNLSYVDGVLNQGQKAVTTFADWADLALKPFSNNEVYVPVLIIALVSIGLQYLQVKQTMPKKKQDIKDPNEKLANATPYIMVILFGWISLSVAGAISFYIGAGALVAIFQQYFLINKEKKEALIEESTKPVVKVTTEKDKKAAKKATKKSAPAKKKTSAKKTNSKKTSSSRAKKK